MLQKILVTSLIFFNAVSILGSVLTEFAIPWLVLQMTGSPTYVGILLGLKFIPVFLSSIIGGGMIDRYGRIKVSQYADLLNFFAVAAIPLFYMYDQLDMSLLAMLVFLSSILDNPGRGAKDVILAEEIDGRKLKHEKVNGFNSLVESLADLLGPVLAGLLIGIYGVVNLLWFDAFSFLIPIIGLALLHKYLMPQKLEAAEAKPKSDLLFGIKYIFKQQSVFWLLLLNAVISMSISVLLFIYLPIFAKMVLNSALDQGVIMLFFASGTISSALLYTFLGDKFAFKKLLILGYGCLTLSLIGINFATGLWQFAITIGFVGLFLGFSGPLEASYLQRKVKSDIRGRVFGAYYGLRQLLVPIAMPLVGYYLEFISPFKMVENRLISSPNLMLILGCVLGGILLVYVSKFYRVKD